MVSIWFYVVLYIIFIVLNRFLSVMRLLCFPLASEMVVVAGSVVLNLYAYLLFWKWLRWLKLLMAISSIILPRRLAAILMFDGVRSIGSVSLYRTPRYWKSISMLLLRIRTQGYLVFFVCRQHSAYPLVMLQCTIATRLMKNRPSGALRQ